ncbi:SDR family NAD(P)-dependent oxidoreductase [Phreatobacter stygius]|uniref:SDR family oxidoreductase n=1 Tax=Phreatobacter stygius TaxID=1940610 RepID=A0A4D7AXH8_9HYPH|nr:SDR family oxidoreductase [Phreatobacter stygius]QCI64185.1 SDR family oxidoreductase [Phreatobacter stygius]
MSFDFKGKRVVIAGGSRGIGRSIALGFAEAGAGVSICARGADGLKATAAEIGRFGGAVHFAPCDLANAASIAGYIPAAAQALGGIDILVNNASGFGQGDTEEGWEAGMQVDIMAVVRASRAAQPFLEQAKGASIVNIASISGYRPSLRTAAYAAVKAAVIQYTTSQAAALSRKGIRVNCVAPGSVEFPGGMWEQRKTTDPTLYNRTLGSIPFGRMGSPEEIANVVLFLASPLASWVTAQTIVADGGQLLG